MVKKKICVVEDDRDINDLITYHLTRDGYDVMSLFEGAQAISFIHAHKPDLIILDLMLPEVDGLEICRLLRSNESTKQLPVIMLTAKGEESDVVVGLQMGADDYMSKPFSPKVLVARVKALLRRSTETTSTHDSSSHRRDFGDLTIDLLKHKVTFKSSEIKLTMIEFDILAFLSKNPGRVFSREQILNGVWKDGKFIIDRAVDVHVRGLRKKLDKADDYVETVRGVGYRFKEI